MQGGGCKGEGVRVLKPKQYARLSNEVKCKKKKKKTTLHNVEHVVQSTFKNVLATFYAQTLHVFRGWVGSEEGVNSVGKVRK